MSYLSGQRRKELFGRVFVCRICAAMKTVITGKRDTAAPEEMATVANANGNGKEVHSPTAGRFHLLPRAFGSHFSRSVSRALRTVPAMNRSVIITSKHIRGVAGQ